MSAEDSNYTYALVRTDATHLRCAHFCNETVYGNLNVLSVTGVVRLDPNALDDDEDEAEGANDGGDGSDASSESEVTFGWPSADAHDRLFCLWR